MADGRPPPTAQCADDRPNATIGPLFSLFPNMSKNGPRATARECGG